MLLLFGGYDDFGRSQGGGGRSRRILQRYFLLTVWFSRVILLLRPQHFLSLFAELRFGLLLTRSQQAGLSRRCRPCLFHHHFCLLGLLSR